MLNELLEGETKYFVLDQCGKAYTPLCDTSGEALAIATNKFIGTPQRKRSFAGCRETWLRMKADGFSIGTFKPSNAKIEGSPLVGDPSRMEGSTS